MEGHNRVLSHQPFPVNTRGFFYFFRHPRIPMASALRFRLTQNPDPHAFAKGNDLLTEFGTPWQISLLAIAKSPRYSILREILLRDRFVTNQLLTRCEEMMAPRFKYAIGPWNQLVFETLEPFYLDLSKPTNGIVLVGMENLYPTPLTAMFSRANYPFKCTCRPCASTLTDQILIIHLHHSGPSHMPFRTKPGCICAQAYGDARASYRRASAGGG